MSAMLTEPDADLFENIFTSDGTWVLINQSANPLCVGVFGTEQEAINFRDSYLPSYTVVQVVDPEDAVRGKSHGLPS